MSENLENALSGGDQISDAIQKILANPKIISDVAAAIGMSPPARSDEAIPSEEHSSGGDSILSSLAPTFKALSTPGGTGAGVSKDQACLLRSLKPYVSEGRRQAIDYIIRITEISQLLKSSH